jgi:prepilin-type N-terminal cleavage/methylation domain-containing protein/prepilin-type processing-associated H-X9-DG protein
MRPIDRFHPGSGARGRAALASRGFSLTELLVVMAVIALLAGILIPAISHVRQAGLVTKDLTNLRSFQIAHQMYMNDHDGHFVDMNLPHAQFSSDPSVVPWIESLQEHYQSELAVRSPLDASPHWPSDMGGAGMPLPVPAPDGYPFRRTSYGCNAFLSWSLAPSVEFAMTGETAFVYDRLSKIKSPAGTVDFLLMAETGDYAGSDHVHPEDWSHGPPDAAPHHAAGQMHIAAAGGPEAAFTSRSNYGFLDGHARTLEFSLVFRDAQLNRFDPACVIAMQAVQAAAPQ